MDPIKQLVNFEPNDDRIVIEVGEKKNISPGGVLLPSSVELPMTGKVMAVGPLCTYSPGDIIAYGKFAGSEILIEDRGYLIMRNLDIFGKFLI
jgi:chaperonin GroES